MPPNNFNMPLYVTKMADYYRLKSFAHHTLPTQDKFTTTIARVERTDIGEPALFLFFPLLPDKKLECHPDIPNHDYAPIVCGLGSENIELYTFQTMIMLPLYMELVLRT